MDFFHKGDLLLHFTGHCTSSGLWHYPFQVQIPSDPRLPAPFQNSYGNLDYRLVVYMISHSSATYVKLAEKSMKCDGHYNLFYMEEASKPITIEQFYRKSYFSQKKLIKATLSVQNAGFLQHEDIPFSLFLKNPKCIPLQLSVNLLQHVKYQANTNLASVVKIVTAVESQERDECDVPKPEIQWVGTLRVPENQTPTYACNSVCMYNVSYVLEVRVVLYTTVQYLLYSPLDYGGNLHVCIDKTVDSFNSLLCLPNPCKYLFSVPGEKSRRNCDYGASKHNFRNNTRAH